MQVIQVDIIGLQALHGLSQVVFQRSVNAECLYFPQICEMHFRCQYDILPEIFYGFSEDPLVMAFVSRIMVRAIGFSCIIESAAEIICLPDRFDAV